MAADGFVLEIPEMVGIPLAAERRPQRATKSWPAGTVIVSADSHILEDDCWFDRFPAHLKDRAPRMTFRDGHWDLTLGGKPMMPPEFAKLICSGMECNPGISNIEARLRDLDIEGVDKELLFPQRLFGLYMMGDFDLREEIYSAYNESIAARCKQASGRLYAVMVPNYWDMSKAKASVDRCAELGARCLMVPISPRKDVDGNPIQYNDPKMDPLWDAVAESGIPLCFHIGEGWQTDLPGAAHAFTLWQMQGFRPTWGALTFGGVFDRFPKLKVVFAEAGLTWVASMLHDADMIYTSFPNLKNPELKHPPSWYWRNHCYATFMTDPAGLDLLHRVPPETVLWSSDYPHQESTFGYTRSAIEAVFKATTVEIAQMIVGHTALKLFNMT